MDGCLLIMISQCRAHGILCAVLYCSVPRVRVLVHRLSSHIATTRPVDQLDSTRQQDGSSCVESPSRISYMPKPGLLHLRYEPTGEMGTLTCSRPAHETCSPSWLTVTSPRLPAGAVSGLPSPVRAHLRNMPALSGQRPSVGVRKHGKLLFGTRLATLNTCQDW